MWSTSKQGRSLLPRPAPQAAGWQPACGDTPWHTPRDRGARDTPRCHLCLNVTPEPDGFSQKRVAWLPRHGDNVCQTYQTQAIKMNVTEPSPETRCVVGRCGVCLWNVPVPPTVSMCLVQGLQGTRHTLSASVCWMNAWRQAAASQHPVLQAEGVFLWGAQEGLCWARTRHRFVSLCAPHALRASAERTPAVCLSQGAPRAPLELSAATEVLSRPLSSDNPSEHLPASLQCGQHPRCGRPFC